MSTIQARVMLQLDFDPDGLVEQVRGTETSAWRGDVQRPGK